MINSDSVPGKISLGIYRVGVVFTDHCSVSTGGSRFNTKKCETVPLSTNCHGCQDRPGGGVPGLLFLRETPGGEGLPDSEGGCEHEVR